MNFYRKFGIYQYLFNIKGFLNICLEPVEVKSILIERLVTLDVNKEHIIQGAGKLGPNDATQGETNRTGLPPDQKSKQRRVAHLSL